MMRYTKLIVLTMLTAALAGCEGLFDLDIQENIEHSPQAREPFEFDMTAWEWLDSYPADSGFSLMRDAIVRAGYDELFNRTDTTFTFFFVNNTGLNDPTLKGNGKPKLGGFVKDVAGNKTAQAIFDAGNLSLEGVAERYVKWLVEYHTLPGEMINQSDITPRNTEFVFNTMYQDSVSGFVVLETDVDLQITVNASSLLEEGNKQVQVRWHNYRFKNGVAHLAEKYVSYHQDVKKAIGG